MRIFEEVQLCIDINYMYSKVRQLQYNLRIYLNFLGKYKSKKEAYSICRGCCIT